MRRRSGALASLAFVTLLLGCGERAASMLSMTDAGSVAPSGRSACAGPAPRAQLNGMEVELGAVDGRGAVVADCADCPLELIEVTFPLEEYPLAEELVVTVAVPRRVGRPAQVDLSHLPEGLSIRVIGTPFPSVAVKDTTIFSSSAGRARGSLRLDEDGVLSFCLELDRQTDWFHPDHVVLYLPSLIIP